MGMTAHEQHAEAFDVLLKPHDPNPDRVLWWHDRQWHATVTVPTGSTRTVTYSVNGRTGTITVPERTPVTVANAPDLPTLADIVDVTDPVHRSPTTGQRARWRRHDRATRTRWDRTMTRMRAEWAHLPVDHLPAAQPDTAIDPGLREGAVHVVEFDDRRTTLRRTITITVDRNTMGALPQLCTRQLIHQGVHHATGRRWAELTDTLHLDRLLAAASDVAEHDVKGPWPVVLVAGNTNRLLAPTWVFGPVVVNHTTFGTGPGTGRTAGTDQLHGHGQLDLDGTNRVDATLAALAANGPWQLHRAPRADTGPHQLAVAAEAHGHTIGFTIGFVATGQTGPTIVTVDPKTGHSGPALAAAFTWAEAIMDAHRTLADMPNTTSGTFRSPLVDRHR